MISGRCTKSKWHVFGLLKKSILLKTLKIGINSIRMSNTSLSMFLLSSLLLMVLYLKILLRDSWLRFKSQKQDAFMGSKWWWKIFILKLIHYWLILIFKTQMKNYFCSKLFKIFHLWPKKLNGLWDGLGQIAHLLKGLLLLPVLKEFSSLEVSVPYFGWKKEDWCQDWLFQMSL